MDYTEMCGLSGRSLRVQNFYVIVLACFRVGNYMNDWFPVTVELCRGCPVSPWLFNIYMDGVVGRIVELKGMRPDSDSCYS